MAGAGLILAIAASTLLLAGLNRRARSAVRAAPRPAPPCPWPIDDTVDRLRRAGAL